jgi:Kef-type K+ transport system membrane component KefB
MMRAALRLLLVLAVLVAVAALGRMRGLTGTPVAFAGGGLLLAGLFAGKVARGAHLPKLTGYLLCGFLIGPAVLRLIPGDALDGLTLVKGLAVSLIALAAGTELHVGLIKRMGLRVAGLCSLASGAAFVVVAGTLYLLRPVLPFLKGMSNGQSIAIASLAGAVLASFSVTVTIAIISETRAHGTLTEFLLAFVIIGDLIVLVAFAFTVAWVRATLGGHWSGAELLRDVGWELFGSIGVGAILGGGVALFLRRVGREVPVFIAALCFLSAQLGAQLHLSPLLISVTAGALLANFDTRHVEQVSQATESVSLPVFAIFFGAAGASLHADALRIMGPVALLLAALRAGTAFLVTRAVLPRSEPVLRSRLWMGLISQAGVTFGLAAIVGRTFPGLGPQLETLFVAVVTVNELVGPILTRRALAGAGEIAAAGEA